MAAPIDNMKVDKTLSKNAEKRLNRKHQKAIQRLKLREGLEPSQKPTKNLYVANAGLGNGVTRAEVDKVFRSFGELHDIIMEENKPHTFVCYRNVADAVSAHSSVNGRTLVCPDEVSAADIQIFTAFVDSVPGLGDTSKFGILPPGLTILHDVIDEEYEQNLLDSLTWDEDSNCDTDESCLKHRRVKHFGYEFMYGTNNVNPEQPLPNDIPGICDQFLNGLEESGHLSQRPDQLTVNRYSPGQGIPPHVDTHSAFTDTIVSLSLGSDCVMEFRHADGRHSHVMLPRRSALIMTGESRYVWTHGITPRKSDLVPADGGATLQYRGTRTSFTFRRLRRNPCDCNYPSQCDSQQKSQSPEAGSSSDHLVLPKSDLEALRLESEHVHKVYEDIADHFSDTRHSPWPRVAQFLRSLPDHSVVLDVGCGNGKYLGVNRRVWAVGTDRSSNLVRVCLDRGHQTFVCDVTAVPWRDEICDACICIAVIHHLSTEERRLSAVRELIRLLRPGGVCLIYVWALEQELHKVRSNYLNDSRIQQKQTNSTDNLNNRTGGDEQLPVHVNRTHFQKQDVLVPWHKRNKEANESGNVYHRFYHVFEEGELEKLCLRVPGISVIEGYYDKGNWCVILRKND